MQCLAKRPEDRPANTEALLQALWDAAKERKVPHLAGAVGHPPGEGPGEMTAEELLDRLEQKLAADRRAREEAPPERQPPPVRLERALS